MSDRRKNKPGSIFGEAMNSFTRITMYETSYFDILMNKAPRRVLFKDVPIGGGFVFNTRVPLNRRHDKNVIKSLAAQRKRRRPLRLGVHVLDPRDRPLVLDGYNKIDALTAVDHDKKTIRLSPHDLVWATPRWDWLAHKEPNDERIDSSGHDH